MAKPTEASTSALAGKPAPKLATTLPRWVERLTWLLDDAIRVPGTNVRFGLDAIIGALLPGVGDALTLVGSSSLLLLAVKQRVQTVILLKMLLNIAIDATLGAIPLLGDVFDLAYKSNRKNLALLKAHSKMGTGRARAVDYLVVALALMVLVAAALLPVVLIAFVVESFAG
jgi:hypothetical protein